MTGMGHDQRGAAEMLAKRGADQEQKRSGFLGCVLLHAWRELRKRIDHDQGRRHCDGVDRALQVVHRLGQIEVDGTLEHEQPQIAHVLRRRVRAHPCFGSSPEACAFARQNYN